MNRAAPVLILAAALAGCASQQQVIATDDVRCRSYGIAVGSPPYVACRMRLDELRAAQHRSTIEAGGLPGAISSAIERPR